MREILNLRKTADGGYLINGYVNASSIDEDVQAWLAAGKEVMPAYTQKELDIIYKANVPKSISMRQARLQLLSLGLLDDVETAITNIEDLTVKKTIQIEWEYAKDIERNSPTILLLSQAISLDDKELDNLFIEAAKL